MSLVNTPRTVLHLEDDPIVAYLVKSAFQGFGFRGEFLSASTVEEGLTLLDDREKNRQPVHLIIVDMNLPDGSGMEVIRTVKHDPRWHLTPVIVLSSDVSPETVNAAYALGAGCFLKKLPSSNELLDSLDALYRCWIEGAAWPQHPPIDRFKEVLARGVTLRARVGRFFMGAARASSESGDILFWLERSMNEGNLSNLMAFFQPLASEPDAPADLIQRLAVMQDRLQVGLREAESIFRSNSPKSDDICRAVIGLIKVLDQSAIIDIFKYLLTLSPEAASTFTEHAAAHLREIIRYVLGRTRNRELLNEAKKLQDWVEALSLTAADS